MAERTFNNYSVPDHLVGDEGEEEGPLPTGVRQSQPSEYEAYLEAYYSQGTKTPDHLDGSLESLPDDKRRMGSQRENVKKKANDALTVRRRVGENVDVYADPALEDPVFQGMVDDGTIEVQEQPDTAERVDAGSRPQYSIPLPASGGELDITNMPLSWSNQRDREMQWMADNPQLMRTLIEAEVTPAEIVQVVDFDYARQTAEDLFVMSQYAQSAGINSATGKQVQRTANGIIRNLNPNMRMIVRAMGDELVNDVVEQSRMDYYSPPNMTSTEVEETPEGVIETGGDVLSRFWDFGWNINWLLDRLPPEVAQQIKDNPLLPVTEQGKLRTSLGGAFDTLFGVVDVSQQAFRLGFMNPGSIFDESKSMQEVWNLAAEGAISPDTQQELVQKYGSGLVRRVLQLKRWADEGEDPMTMALTEWGPNDPYASDLVLLFTGVNEGSERSREIEALVKDLGYATNDSFFNIFMGNEYRGDFLDNTKPIVDLSLGLAADPFLWGSVPFKVLRGSRYALAKLNKAQADELDRLIKLTDPEDAVQTANQMEAAGLISYDPLTGNAIPTSPSVTKMFSRPKVKRAFDAVGGKLRQIDNIEDLGERSTARAALISSWKKYFPEEMLKEMSDAKVYSAEDAMYWYHDNSLVSKILGGRGAQEPPSVLMPKEGTEQAAKLKGSAVTLGDAVPFRRATEWQNDPYAMVNLAQKATGKPMFPNISWQGNAAKRAAGFGKLAVLDFVTAPQRKVLNTVYERLGGLGAASGDDVSAVQEVLTNYPELVAAFDSDWLVAALNGDEIITPVTLGNIDEIIEYMGAMKSVADKGSPVFKAQNTGWGMLYNALRKARNDGKGRSVTKEDGSRRRFPGRALYVNGRDVLEGKPLNNTVGRRRKDLVIAPTFKQLFDENWWRETVYAGTARRVDRWSRAAARYPHNTLLNLDGSNPRAVYEYARAWGMSTAQANILREVWKQSTPAQRKQMANAIAESAVYSRGIPYLFRDPDDARAFIKDMRAGDTDTSAYSTSVRNTGATPLDLNPYPITDDMDETVDGYVNGLLFSEVNMYLRDLPELRASRQRMIENGPEGVAPQWEPLDAVVEKLDDFTQTSVATEPMQVYRGANMPISDVENLVAGSSITELQYLSTSRNQSFARIWTDGGPDAGGSDVVVTPMGTTPVWYTIDVPVGSRFGEIRRTSSPDNGEEVLLPRDTSMTVTRVEDVYDPETGALIGKEVFAEIEPPSVSPDSWNPAVYNGPNGEMTSALSSWQTTDAVPMPDMAAMERLMARQSVLSGMLGRNPAWEGVVNLWSILTLAGPRYQFRAALEDFVFYGFTNEPGAFARYFRGQEADEALRLARGELPNVTKQYVSPLAVRMLGEYKSTQELRNWLRPVEKSEAADAMRDYSMGNRRTLMNLMNKAKSRQAMSMLRDKPWAESLYKFFTGGKKSLTAEDEKVLRWLDEMVLIDNGLFRFDEVSEGGKFITNGTVATSTAQRRVPGMEQGVVTTRGEVIISNQNMSNSAVSKSVFEAWGREIFGQVTGDGDVAQVALRNLDYWATGDSVSQSRVLDDMVDAINEMPAKWRDNLVMINDLGAREYARRYLDYTLGVFSRRDGSVNDELLNLLRLEDGTYSGYNASFDRLSQIGRTGDGYDISALPMSIYDKYGTVNVSVANNMGVGQKVFSMMGNSLSRTTREPIWQGNYILARKQLEGFEESTYQYLRSTGMSDKQARQVAGMRTADIASERAMNLTLSYTDNPNTRSMLAWQVRNVSRYWRAQEDLFRRLGRAARYKPMGIWRGALTYELMSTNGFLWENNQGEQYFVYPGLNEVISTLASVGTKITGSGGTLVGGLPTTFTGKLNLLTPSADPNAMFPTVTPGIPVVAWEAGMFLDRFVPGLREMLDGIEPVVWGEYGAPEGMENIPYNWRRLVEVGYARFQSPEDRKNIRTGLFADSVVIALKGLVAADRIPENVEWDPLVKEQFTNDVQNTALWVAGLRAVFGFWEPSRTRLEENTPSEFARELGISGFRPEFYKLLNEYEGDWNRAATRWIEMFPDLAPFTVSSNEAGTRLGEVPYGRVTSSPQAVEFLQENRDLLFKYPTALPYLSPYGESNVDAAIELSEEGLRQKSTVGELINDVIFSEETRLWGSYRYQDRKYREKQSELLEAGEITAEEYERRVSTSEDLLQEKKEEITADSPLGAEYISDFDPPKSYTDSTYIDQLRGAVDELQAKDVFISAGVNDTVNKVSIAATALTEFDKSVANLNELAAQADELGVTEMRRRERAEINAFTRIVDDNFGWPGGANASSLQEFAEIYMIPTLEGVYKEKR